MLIKLKGSNKKLIQQCGAYTKQANIAAAMGMSSTFKVMTAIAHKKLRALAIRLDVDTSNYYIAPNKSWDGIVLIAR